MKEGGNEVVYSEVQYCNSDDEMSTYRETTVHHTHFDQNGPILSSYRSLLVRVVPLRHACVRMCAGSWWEGESYQLSYTFLNAIFLRLYTCCVRVCDRMIGWWSLGM